MRSHHSAPIPYLVVPGLFFFTRRGGSMNAIVVFLTVVITITATASSVLGDSEATALRSRHSIKDVHVIVDSVVYEHAAGSKKIIWSTKDEILCDGENRRRLHRTFKEDDPRTYKPKHALCITDCFGHFTRISYFDRPERGGNTTPVIVKKHDGGKESADDVDLYGIPDPRVFGIVPESIAGTFTSELEVILARPDRTNAREIEEVVEGSLCKVVEYKRKDGIRTRIGFPSDSEVPQVRFVELSTDADGKEFRLRVDSEYSKSDSVLPSKVHFQRYEGDSIVAEEFALIQVLGLNQGTEKSDFCLEALGVSKGTVVRRYDLASDSVDRKGVWNGSSVVRHESAAAADAIPREGLGSWFIVLNLLVILILGVVIFRRRS
jgi:hypothetical protein